MDVPSYPELLPYAAPIEASDGFLYGTTGLGGAHGLGPVYGMDRTGTGTVLHTFERRRRLDT